MARAPWIEEVTTSARLFVVKLGAKTDSVPLTASGYQARLTP